MKTGRILTGLLVLLLALSIVSLMACGGKSPLVGKWNYIEDGGEYFIEFFDDGTLEMGNESLNYSCAWEETGDNEVTLTLLAVNGEEVDDEDKVVLDWDISGDELTMDDGDEAITFTRE